MASKLMRFLIYYRRTRLGTWSNGTACSGGSFGGTNRSYDSFEDYDFSTKPLADFLTTWASIQMKSY